ncbi:TPA: hypothetical protein QDB01_000974 [Burkholderia vietnamiensis]|nr:hypothetical protein [Burkholderia vietnamiensis]
MEKELDNIGIDLGEAKKQLVAARSRLRLDIETAKSKLTALLDERAHLYDALVPVSDIKQFLLDYIDLKRREYMPVVREMLMDVMYPRRLSAMEIKPISAMEIKGVMEGSNSRIDKSAPMGSFDLVRKNKVYHTDIPLYCFFGDQIKRVIEENFDSLGIEYMPGHASEVGPPLAERHARAAALAGEIRDAEANLQELKAKLSALEVA